MHCASQQAPSYTSEAFGESQVEGAGEGLELARGPGQAE